MQVENYMREAEVLNEPKPNIDEQGFEFLDSLIALLSRRKLIFRTTVIVAVLMVIVVLLLPNKYTAETVVLPPQQNSSLSSTMLGQFAGNGALASLAGAGLGIKNPGDMYAALFRTHGVEDAIIQKFGLMKRYHDKKMVDARRDFEDHSTVVLGVKDGLIRVTVTDWDPKLAADIANAYVDQFRDLSQHLAITEASQRRLFFQQQLFEANDNLTRAEEALRNTEQTTGLLEINSQARSLIESAAQLRGQIAATQVELKAMQTYATPDNPQVVTAQEQLAALKAQLAQLAGSSKNASSDIIVPKGNIPQAGMEYLRKLRDVKYYETIDELIAKQFELAKLDEAREGAIVQVADVATPPDKKSSPHRLIIVILMTFLAFSFSCLWVLARARWKQTLLDPVKNKKAQTLRGLLPKRRR
jgi:uncharacterized protein involved in exopolysaccharide biosynthesis